MGRRGLEPRGPGPLTAGGTAETGLVLLLRDGATLRLEFRHG